MTFKLLSFIFLVLPTPSWAESQVIKDARTAILNTIIARPELGPKYLRLVFHDCVSKACDGCVNLGQKDNKGLDVPINALEQVYMPRGKPSTFSKAMSRADIWALAAIEAIKWGVANANAVNNPGCDEFNCQYEMPPVPFTADRKDCPTSPNNAPGVKDPLPDASSTTTGQFWKYFADNFGFDKRETLALMGAHAFGQTFKVNSGFNMSWTLDSWNALDNFYFHTLVEPMYGWEQLNQNAGTNLPPAYIWRCVDSDNPDNNHNTCGFNLNVDMELIMELNPGQDGKAKCKFQGAGSCPPINDVIAIAREYDDFAPAWAEDFVNVLTRLINRR